MSDIVIQKAEMADAPYIKEKLCKYLLDSDDASWKQFFVASLLGKTVAFARIKDHPDFFELASLGVDYYQRKKGVATKMLSFLIEEARRIDFQKPIYAVTHRPGLLEKLSFKEVALGPASLEYKRHYKCILDISKNKIMKLVDGDASRRGVGI